jgi:hypothetical protein
VRTAPQAAARRRNVRTLNSRGTHSTATGITRFTSAIQDANFGKLLCCAPLPLARLCPQRERPAQRGSDGVGARAAAGTRQSRTAPGAGAGGKSACSRRLTEPFGIGAVSTRLEGGARRPKPRRQPAGSPPRNWCPLARSNRTWPGRRSRSAPEPQGTPPPKNPRRFMQLVPRLCGSF